MARTRKANAKKKITIDGVEYESLKNACEAFNIPYNRAMNFYHYHKNKGCSIEDTIKHFRKDSDKNKTIKSNELFDTVTSNSNDILKFMNTDEEDKIEVLCDDFIRESIDENTRDIIKSLPSMVDSVQNIVDLVDKFKFRKINLFDFENINKVSWVIEILSQIDKTDLNIFIFNKTLHSNCYFKLLAEYGEEYCMTSYGTLTATNQLCDHLIAYILGVLSSRVDRFMIISNDTGYSPFIDTITRSSNLNIELKYIPKEKLKNRFTFSLCRSIATRPEDFKQYKTYTREDLRKLFKTYFKSSINIDQTMTNIITSLTEVNVLKDADKIADVQYYYIDSIEAGRYIKENADE